MTIQERKFDFLRYAKDFCFSKQYVVFCTGRSAHILNSKFELLHKVEKLYYVYRACVSPDEKTLLLISNGSMFYLVNLEDFSLEKYVIRGNYNNNLEGQGCWSFSGDALYFPVNNRKTFNSALRCYKMNEEFSHEDLMAEKYWLTSISPVKELNKYLLTGMDRRKEDQADCWNMIWFDGKFFEEYPVPEMRDDGISLAEYDAMTNTVLVYGHSRTIRCDIHGNCLSDIPVPEGNIISSSFSGAFKNMGLDEESFEYVKTVSGLFGLENLSIEDNINKVCASFDGRYFYIGTRTGLYIVHAKTQAVEASLKIEYGVQNVKEISPRFLAISTWHGVKLLEIQENG